MATEITLLEIDAPHAQFNAPFSGRGGSSEADRARADDSSVERTTDTRSERSGLGRLLPLLLVLALIGLAALVRALREKPIEGTELDRDED